MTMPGAEALLVWCPFPDEAEARSVAGTLLDEGLIACANIVPGVVSIYRWQGERGEAREAGVLFKSHENCRTLLLDRLAQLHSYASPAIMAWHANAAPRDTIAWLESAGGNGGDGQ